MALNKISSADPDYSHLGLSQSIVNITLTKVEKEAVLTAYDYGLESLNDERKHLIDIVLAKLKDQIWR